jgi:DNA modification methylase
MSRIANRKSSTVSRAQKVVSKPPKRFSSRELYRLHHGDTRTLAPRLPSEIVDVTVTSPPYFDLKNYATKNQIGYGQSYAAYLKDLTRIFREVHRATRKKGSLWIIIDTFQRDQEILPLPFDLARELRTAGWSLRDIIIWKKERTLPWVHEGKTKKIFEYILVFSKVGESFRYLANKLRDQTDLKRWWVKYPERYNPRGKALEEIWNFDIPVQGSWDPHKNQIPHFCPLPEALVGRILELTTRKQDTVLDPFAGSGTVLSEARAVGRKAIGFELNYKYVRKFSASLRHRKSRSKKDRERAQREKANFKALIQDLRLLKFGRLLYRKLSTKPGGKAINHVFVRKTNKRPLPPHKLFTSEYVLYAPELKNSRRILRAAVALSEKKPLSKFGIQPEIRLARRPSDLPSSYRLQRIYCYSSANSHKFKASLTLSAALKEKFPLASHIKVKVEEPDD